MKSNGNQRNNSRRQSPAAAMQVIPLKRSPNIKLSVHVDELDKRMNVALEAVIRMIMDEIRHALSLERIHVLATKAHLLLAMQSTHRSIRKLVVQESNDWDLSVDALPLTRVQLERTFLSLLLEDNPDRWHRRYRKNAWKAFAEKFFRDQKAMSSLEVFKEHFANDGKGISILRAFAREMGVWEDEFQTVLVQTTGCKPDRRWPMRYIAQMPTPGRTLELLEEEQLRIVGRVIYPYYDSLSHFSHGGMVGIMHAAILRPDGVVIGGDFDRGRFFQTSIVENTLPLSYLSILTVATLFAARMGAGKAIHDVLDNAWRPYHCDGSPLGVLIWDSWAQSIMETSWPVAGSPTGEAKKTQRKSDEGDDDGH